MNRKKKRKLGKTKTRREKYTNMENLDKLQDFFSPQRIACAFPFIQRFRFECFATYVSDSLLQHWNK